jgi:hypothetical protein
MRGGRPGGPACGARKRGYRAEGVRVRAALYLERERAARRHVRRQFHAATNVIPYVRTHAARSPNCCGCGCGGLASSCRADDGVLLSS